MTIIKKWNHRDTVIYRQCYWWCSCVSHFHNLSTWQWNFLCSTFLPFSTDTGSCCRSGATFIVKWSCFFLLLTTLQALLQSFWLVLWLWYWAVVLMAVLFDTSSWYELGRRHGCERAPLFAIDQCEPNRKLIVLRFIILFSWFTIWCKTWNANDFHYAMSVVHKFRQ